MTTPQCDEALSEEEIEAAFNAATKALPAVVNSIQSLVGVKGGTPTEKQMAILVYLSALLSGTFLSFWPDEAIGDYIAIMKRAKGFADEAEELENEEENG